MPEFQVPCCKGPHPSRDPEFRHAFSDPLNKNPPRLSKEGYIRALQLYGREDHRLDSLKSRASRFADWRNLHPGDIDKFRRHAAALGYDWEHGTVNEDGLYTTTVLANPSTITETMALDSKGRFTPLRQQHLPRTPRMATGPSVPGSSQSRLISIDEYRPTSLKRCAGQPQV